MEKIFYNNTLIAVKFNKFKNGTVPLTDPLEPLQVLVHKRQKGKHTPAHMHIPKERVTQKLQECLVVMKGKIRIDFYGIDNLPAGRQGKFLKSIYLSAGEIVIFMNGGHAVHLLQDSEIVEVKNGPFVEDKVLIE